MIMISTTDEQTRHSPLLSIKGRGAAHNPANRFEPIALHPDGDWLDCGETGPIRTEYYEDSTRSILSRNDSPDIPFTYGLNPYRGCEHGCVYCYARPTHEYFGLSAGLDFETKIFVKRKAPQLLEEVFRGRRWQPQCIALSGNTDCYQPAERHFEITRGCLEVFLKYRNPVGIITKNALVLRDRDLLVPLAARNLVRVFVSVTTLDNKLARKLEPRTSAPVERLRAIRELASAGVPTGVMVAPVIPGLTDHEMPSILAAAADCGACTAGYTLLRLPYAVKELFTDWLARHYPERANKIVGGIKDTRCGRLSDPNFGSRMRGEGERAEAIKRLFSVARKKYGLDAKLPPLSNQHFRRALTSQGDLFAAV